jgi:anhydro-N-acetylmuramic acid kinase
VAPELYIGLLSGTSIDSIDAAILDFSSHQITLLETHSEPIDADLRTQLIDLCSPGDNEIDRLGLLDRQLGLKFAKAVNALLEKTDLKPSAIKAIGSHGQTIRHRPADASRKKDRAFSLQIGDPNTITENCSIATVADFRRRDIAADGQGAPLVPLFHQAAFAKTGINRAIVNIGGMSNVSLLASDQKLTGFDTGPGNVLLDSWIRRQQGHDYDRDGSWAASGLIDDELLEAMLEHPFLSRPAPKSTGREDFNLDWLLHLAQKFPGRHPENIQATLLEMTARSISDTLLQTSEPLTEIYICGGGASNLQLMARLQELLLPLPVNTTTQLGIPPGWVEASAFAWFAKQTLEGCPSSNSAVTGAKGPRVLGGIFQC